MKNKIIVIYKSKTGFTKRYAEMISEKVSCTLVEHKTVTAEMMSDYDIVVFGTRIHAGMMDGYKEMKEMFQKSASNRFILFVTGATPASAEEIIKDIWTNNLSADEMLEIPHFYMQSGLSYEKMSLPDKLMMKFAASIMKKKKDKTAHEQGFEQAISSSYDATDKASIEPIVSLLKEITANEKN